MTGPLETAPEVPEFDNNGRASDARPAPSMDSTAHAVESVGAPTFWPYPRWIAHRGAGQLAPENTLAAFKLGARHGYRMFECDVKLSADGVAFLLHDDSLDRTTSGQGMAGAQTWQALAKLDAGSWHSPDYAGEALPTFESIARWCLDHDFLLNIEIKPTPGVETQTGTVVAHEAARLWQNADVPPLLTSFKPQSLQAAMRAQPQLPRGLLLSALSENWLQTARQLECVAIVCQHRLWSMATVAQAKEAGFKTLSYTVNDAASVDQLLELDTDGIITDRVDLFKPSSP